MNDQYGRGISNRVIRSVGWDIRGVCQGMCFYNTTKLLVSVVVRQSLRGHKPGRKHAWSIESLQMLKSHWKSNHRYEHHWKIPHLQERDGISGVGLLTTYESELV